VNLGVRGKHALTQEQVGVAMGLVDKIGPHVGRCQDEVIRRIGGLRLLLFDV